MPDHRELGLRSIDERITRFLCATVHLDGSFANHACGRCCSRPAGRRQAPEAEIDPIALARHAQLSLSRRRERDRQLAFVLLGVVAAGVVLFVLGANDALSMSQAASSCRLLPVAGWLVALAHRLQPLPPRARLRRRGVLGTASFARASAPPLDPEDELRLWRLHWENMVIYNRFSPFVGTGHTVDSWRVNLHTNPPNAARSLGRRRPPFRISPARGARVPAGAGARGAGPRCRATEDDEARYCVTASTACTSTCARPASSSSSGGRPDRPAERTAGPAPGLRSLDQYTDEPNRAPGRTAASSRTAATATSSSRSWCAPRSSATCCTSRGARRCCCRCRPASRTCTG